MFVEICKRLSAGDTLRAICRSVDTNGNKIYPPESTVRLTISQNEEMFAQYASARDLGIDSMVERMFEIADDSSQDVMTDADGNQYENKEFVNRSKLKIDVLKWYTCKLAPKRYGEQLTLKGDKEAPITVNIINDVPDV